jgi:hypothetical protein
LAATPTEMLLDHDAYFYFTNPKAAEQEEFEDAEFDAEAVIEAMKSDDWEEVP